MSKLDTVQADEIQLRRASIHLYELGSNGLELKESGKPVDETTVFQPADFEQFASYFRELTFEAIQNDTKTHKAQFRQRGSDTVCEQISTVFTNPDAFHDTSVQLARRLLKTMPYKAARPSYLIFAEFRAADETCYAILKLDHDVHIAVELTGGSRKAPTVLVHERDLPTSTELKDKFAFLVKPGLQQPYELQVTDRKYQRRQGRHVVAVYFLQEFLGAAFVEDARFMTETFLNTAQSFARAKAEEIMEQGGRLDLFYTGLQHFICRDSVRIREFLDNTLPDQPALQRELRDQLRSAGLSTASFDIDHTYIAERVSRRRITLSNGISIAGDREVMDQNMIVTLADGHYQFEIEAPSYAESY